MHSLHKTLRFWFSEKKQQCWKVMSTRLLATLAFINSASSSFCSSWTCWWWTLSKSCSSVLTWLTGVACRSLTTCRTTYRRTWPFQHCSRPPPCRTVTVPSSTARVRCFHSTTASTTAASSTAGTAAWWSLITRHSSTVHNGPMTSHSSDRPLSVR